MMKKCIPSLRPAVAFLWLSASLASCDSGDIYPDEFEYDSGVVVKASFIFAETETFPSSYQVLFGIFDNARAEPVVSKTIIKPGQGQVVSITLDNLPGDAASIKLCLTTLGKQPVFTFYEMEVPEHTGDSIVIPVQEIHLLQFSRIQQQVFTPSCAACHGSPGAAGLSLVEGVSYNSLVDVPATKSPEPKARIVPSDVEGSFLIDVLEHGDLLKTDHTSIPSKYHDDLALLKEWIRNGAPQ
jgi:hypothetical protein